MTLRAYLLRERLSYQDFATKVGCSRTRIGALCVGDRPSLGLAQRIYVATNKSVGLMDWPMAQGGAV